MNVAHESMDTVLSAFSVSQIMKQACGATLEVHQVRVRCEDVGGYGRAVSKAARYQGHLNSK